MGLFWLRGRKVAEGRWNASPEPSGKVLSCYKLFLSVVWGTPPWVGPLLIRAFTGTHSSKSIELLEWALPPHKLVWSEQAFQKPQDMAVGRNNGIVWGLVPCISPHEEEEEVANLVVKSLQSIWCEPAGIVRSSLPNSGLVTSWLSWAVGTPMTPVTPCGGSNKERLMVRVQVCV